MRISTDGKKLIVFVDFTGGDPGCSFCKFVDHTLWTTIAKEIRDVLIGEGFEEVLVVDVISGASLLWLSPQYSVRGSSTLAGLRRLLMDLICLIR